MDRVLWRWYVAAGAVIVAGYALVPVGLWRDGVYLTIGLSCVTAILVGVRINRPSHTLPWYLMALGQALWVVGDALGSWNDDVAHVNTFPSDADAFYLCAYPVLAVSLALLIRGVRPRRDIGGLLDSATVTAGLGLLSWVLLARPTITASEHSISAAAVGAAYPVADILLAGLVIRLVTSPAGRTPALRLLLSAVGLLIAGDTTSTALSLYSGSTSGGYDVIWLASYVTWGAAALHPSMRSLTQRGTRADVPFSRARLAALTVATLVAPATLAVQWVTGHPIDVWANVTGSVVLFLLVVSRMYLAMMQIVSANRHRSELQHNLAFQAAHDSLTQLPNRAQAMVMIEAALSRAQRNSATVGLLFVDLDGFKPVNDSFGHRAGDEVLREVATRLQAQVRGGDTVARWGGDEFVVVLESVAGQDAAVDVARRLIDAAAAPIVMSDGKAVSVGASIGIAISQDGAIDPERLLREADAALYRGKASGRGRAEVFDGPLRRELAARADLESALTDAIQDGQLELYYQPIIDVNTRRAQGYESLMRWHRPGVGLLQPADFIPTAEESSLICELDSWALREATRQLAAWTRADSSRRHLTMAVNISGRHISNARILDDVRAALTASGVPATQLVLEITETVIIEDLLALQHLHELRKMGVAISIDDFGTGYNSISRLQHLPVDVVKIDRSFLYGTRSSSNLLQLMVQAAHAFGLPVIAEGVETSHQLETLKAMNCESAQGFYFAHPMDAADAEQYLTDTHLTNLRPILNLPRLEVSPAGAVSARLSGRD